MYKCLQALCVLVCVTLAVPASAAGLYSASVVGTDFDFITDADPSQFLCLEYKGMRWHQMPRSPRHNYAVQNTHLFVAYYKDGTVVDFYLDNAFGSESAAETEMQKYTNRLGKLPTLLRSGVDTVIVHKGDGTATSDKNLFVLFSENANERIRNHDLEETMFHESVHAALDLGYRSEPGWIAAQTKDVAFVTDYAEEHPSREDMAESMLFAYTLTHHPNRIPSTESSKIKSQIPNRIAYLSSLIPSGKSVTYQVAPAYACDGSDTRFKTEAPVGNTGAAVVSGDGSVQSNGSGTKEGRVTDNNGNVWYGGQNVAEGLSDVLWMGFGIPDNDPEVLAFLQPQWDQYFTRASEEALIKEVSQKFGYSEADIKAKITEMYGVSFDEVETESTTRADRLRILGTLQNLLAALQSLF